MGLFDIFSTKASTASSTSSTDNKNAVDNGGAAVSGSNNTLLVQSPEAISLAAGTVGAALETVNSQADNAFYAVAQLLESQANVVGQVSANAQDTLSFVREQSQQDLIQYTKDLAPWVIGGLAVFNLPKILKVLF